MTTHHPRRPAAYILTLAVLALAALALSACGSSSPSSTTSSTQAAAGADPSGGAGSGRFAQLRQCLQKNGINLPQRPPGQRGGGGGVFGGAPGAGRRLPAGVTQQQFQAALRKCGGGNFGQRRVNSPAFRQAVTNFASCMRQNGVNLPAPNTSGTGPVFNTSSINRNDPKFKAAYAKCSGQLRGAFPGGGTGGGGGGNAGAGGPTPSTQ